MSGTDERAELLELAKFLGSTHYVDVHFVYITIYPGLGAFKDHFTIGCGDTADDSEEDYASKLEVSVETLSNEEVTNRIERLVETSRYERFAHLALAG